MTASLVMQAQWIAVALYLSGGIAALIFSRSRSGSLWLGAGTAIGGSLVGLGALVVGRHWDFTTVSRLDFPAGGFFVLHFGCDPLTLFFCGLTLLLGLFTALYGIAYLHAHADAPSSGPHWFCFNGLLAGMLLVFMARDAIGFLVAWEWMALTSLGLVLHHHEVRRVRQAGWIYLVASHLGAAALILFFLLLSQDRGGFTFADFTAPARTGFSPHANLLFLLALLGFGTKAGFMPLHVWLPEAHPAAPSHVSALMSAIMIKTGIYGLFRALEWLTPWNPGWGWALVGIGLCSGVLGSLLALANDDLKRLLAYSSIDNIGILALGMGIGILGVTQHLPLMAAAGFAGTLLHVINHALFKGLLFLAAGSVYHATGTRQISQLGGLLKSMPRTALCFLIGAVSICALPPLNGCVGEFLIYWGVFKGYLAAPNGPIAPLLITAAAGLALIGGLSLATFTKAFGLVFLGEPRIPSAHPPRESHGLMLVPMYSLVGICIGMALFAPWVVAGLLPILARIPAAAMEFPDGAAHLQALAPPLYSLSGVCAALWAAGVVLYALRRRRLQQRPAATGVTWDCGYAEPTSRMQYTPSSYAQPLLDPFTPLLNRRLVARIPRALFPKSSALSAGATDLFQKKMFVPFVRSLNRGMDLFRWIQTGRVQIYVLYIIIALIGVILWSLSA